MSLATYATQLIGALFTTRLYKSVPALTHIPLKAEKDLPEFPSSHITSAFGIC